MHQVASYEFGVRQSNSAFGVTRLSASGRKHYHIWCHRKDPAVGNSNLMGITPEIFNGIAKAVKGLLYVGTPVLFIKLVFPLFPDGRILKLFTGGRKHKRAALIQGSQMCHEFSLKLIPQNHDRDEETAGRFPDMLAFGKSAAGNNAVHMHMVVKLLVPCVENLDNPGSCPEILLVSRQFKKCFGTASVKETIQQLLVAVNKRIELVWKCKYHMKVRGIYHLRPALIHPDFLKNSLTVGTVAVTAGIVMKLHVSTVTATAYITAEFCRFAVQNGMGSFPLDHRLEMSGCTEILIGMAPYLLDRGITHDPFLPSGQKG